MAILVTYPEYQPGRIKKKKKNPTVKQMQGIYCVFIIAIYWKGPKCQHHR